MEDIELLDYLDEYINYNYNHEAEFTYDDFPIHADFNVLKFKQDKRFYKKLPLLDMHYGSINGINFLSYEMEVLGICFVKTEFSYDEIQEVLLMQYN